MGKGIKAVAFRLLWNTTLFPIKVNLVLYNINLVATKLTSKNLRKFTVQYMRKLLIWLTV